MPYLITPKLRVATDADVQALSAWLGHPLPPGYADHVKRLGYGTYDNRVIVHMPADIPAQTQDEQDFILEYFDEFWGEDTSITRDEAARAVPFGDSIDGDKILYSCERQQLFVLPRHDDRVYWMPRGFEDPLDWGDGPDLHSDFITFDSGIDRAVVELFTAQSLSVDQVAAAVTQQLEAAHRVDASWGALLYLPALHGRVQLTQAPGDSRAVARIDYDKMLEATLTPVLDALEDLGMFITNRMD
ncbi:SMI1/KNR4 family protein [Pigmentiphaga aceris]|uniref:SMI1/KNR4 family protein n=2 Tax=Pigmentiphaga aceris TaxID=1940612 RepID=A0A5C0B2G3_9BURK|nr:SMI1/KNR4 family protein [Pigmentiphaga aceris]